jgi:hypothetical protein
MGALSLTRRKPRGRSGLHSTPGLASTVLTRRLAPAWGLFLPARSRGWSPGVARSVSIGPHRGWGRSHRRSIHAPLWGSIPRGIRFMINRMTGEPILPARTADQYLATGEPILPARTADQYLARYWSAVRAGKIGSPVMRFITVHSLPHSTKRNTNRTQ